MSRADAPPAFNRGCNRTAQAGWLAAKGAAPGTVEYDVLERHCQRSRWLLEAAVVALAREALVQARGPLLTSAEPFVDVMLPAAKTDALPTHAPLDRVIQIALVSLTKKRDFEPNPIDFFRSGYEDSLAPRLQQKAEARAVNRRTLTSRGAVSHQYPHRWGEAHE